MKQFILALGILLLAQPAFADANATKVMNDFRKANGRNAVAYSQELHMAAQGHAQDMSKRGLLSHTGSSGSDLARRVKRAGYKWCFAAENIAQGQKTFGAAFGAWQKSSGHRKNMLNRKAREFGVAKAKGNYWVMVIAAPC